MITTNLLAILRISEFTRETRISDVAIICPPDCVIKSKNCTPEGIKQMVSNVENAYSLLEKRLAIINYYASLGFTFLFSDKREFENGGNEIVVHDFYMKMPIP